MSGSQETMTRPSRKWGRRELFCCRLPGGAQEYTRYTAGCNAARGSYYVTTYENRQLSVAHLAHAELDSRALTAFPIDQPPGIRQLN